MDEQQGGAHLDGEEANILRAGDHRPHSVFGFSNIYTVMAAEH